MCARVCVYARDAHSQRVYERDTQTDRKTESARAHEREKKRQQGKGESGYPLSESDADIARHITRHMTRTPALSQGTGSNGGHKGSQCFQPCELPQPSSGV